MSGDLKPEVTPPLPAGENYAAHTLKNCVDGLVVAAQAMIVVHWSNSGARVMRDGGVDAMAALDAALAEAIVGIPQEQ